jgi:phosphoribosylaminoimidazole-succinocarboxamide synthase
VVLVETALEGLPKRRGKVRDVYDLGDGRLLIVATDRISAFDWILPTGIPDKGRVLNTLSAWWFARLRTPSRPNHVLSTEIDEAGLSLPEAQLAALRGRVTIARKADVIPFECVVRGYLSGSGWREYRQRGTICGEDLPAGLVESDRLPSPIFTPATKATSGHDENVPFARMVQDLGRERADELKRLSLGYYEEAAREALRRDLILADTKFEFGRVSDQAGPILIDEILTPDSSRYWPIETYRPGGPRRSTSSTCATGSKAPAGTATAPLLPCLMTW